MSAGVVRAPRLRAAAGAAAARVPAGPVPRAGVARAQDAGGHRPELQVRRPARRSFMIHYFKI